MQWSSVLRSVVVLGALAANTAQADLASCARIVADAERLACYDALARSVRGPAPAVAAPAAETAAPRVGGGETTSNHFGTLWELDPAAKRGTFRLLPHRPLLALVHATDRVNPNPASPTRVAGTAAPIELQHVDAKLQLSFKTKLAQDLFGSAADLWFGYTQQSYWQAANSRYSSPFRESNYEPEAVLVHPLPFAIGPVRGAYAALSLDHQSNGQAGSLSRSWNRLIGELAVESGPFSLQLRPWVRLDASADNHDDNPDIEDFIGRGELLAAYRAGRHVLTVRGRHSLRGGDRSHGSAQLDWAYRLAGTLNAHLQMFTGYGESLIDYNRRQTTVGVGVSFFD